MSIVTSTGGSSSYYELPLSPSVVKRILASVEAGEQPIIETGDVIKMLCNNDFDAGNIIKALRRIFQAIEGKGKSGTDIDYDINKCKYFIDEVARTAHDKMDSK